MTLAWSDPPPAAVADLETTLVNRLRLRVTGPGGGEHTDGNTAPDPVASVVVAAPEPGEWVLAVEASEVDVGRAGPGIRAGGRRRGGTARTGVKRPQAELMPTSSSSSSRSGLPARTWTPCAVTSKSSRRC